MRGKTAIIGYSGHAYVVADTAISLGIPLSYYCEKSVADNNPFDLEYLGFEGDSTFVGWKEDFQFVLGVGDNSIRSKIALKILSYKKELPNIIHPSASISRFFKIGVGNFISRQVSINAFADVGNFCILNTGCIIEHECKLEDGAHVAPGAVLAGNVTLGKNVFFGAGAVAKQGVNIGENSIIGAGSVVISDIPSNQIWVGCPAKPLVK